VPIQCAMKPLAPAVFELRVAGGAMLVAAALPAALAGRGADDLRAAAAGLAGTVLLLWCLWGRRALARAIRLALPVRPRWELEATGATVARVLLAQVLPVTAVVVAGAIAAQGRVVGAWAGAAGVAAGAGLAALLAARRARRADVARGRRLLHEPRLGPPLGRRAFHLEPRSLSERPAGPSANPWPAHRPPARSQRAVVELDPANGAARHPVGVRGVPRARRGIEPPRSPPGR
jgi:hypothetical protein